MSKTVLKVTRTLKNRDYDLYNFAQLLISKLLETQASSHVQYRKQKTIKNPSIKKNSFISIKTN